MRNTEYSKAELKLVNILSPHWFEVIKQTDINPSNLYHCLAEEAFISNKQGPHIDALRKVCKAIRDCEPYRLTPEFDKLCEF